MPTTGTTTATATVSSLTADLESLWEIQSVARERSEAADAAHEAAVDAVQAAYDAWWADSTDAAGDAWSSAKEEEERLRLEASERQDEYDWAMMAIAEQEESIAHVEATGIADPREARAVTLGARDGAAAVEAQIAEDPTEPIYVEGWDDAARSAGAHTYAGVEGPRYTEIYYASYNTASRARAAEALADGYAAVGTDGTRLVVWGLGATEAAALADARDQGEIGDQDLDVYPITAAQIAVVEAGAVAWPVA